MAIDKQDDRVLYLAPAPDLRGNSQAVLWTRSFEVLADRDEVLSQVQEGELDLLFLGRLSAIFGPAEIDHAVDEIVAEAEAGRAEALRRADEKALRGKIVNLYARKDKHGRAVLELQRASRDDADWQVRYDRAAERDRLCDWLRWQKPRFLDFLDYAAEHGDEALTRMLTDEMFAAERRIKKEGRGAGGLRPLRMWRGDA